MRALTVIPQRRQRRERPTTIDPWGTGRAKVNAMTGPAGPATIALQRHPRPHTHRTIGGRVIQNVRRAFTPLIDAKAASTLLGVPYTWLLAQARAGTIPHHRLGHYVRFNADDLNAWLRETRIEPRAGYRGR